MTSRIGLFGGSFDPPHLGHLIAAQAAAEQLELDCVLWIPTGASYHKTGTGSAEHRVEMVRLAIADQPVFELSTVDVDRNGPTYSYDTVQDIRLAYPDAELVFLLGEDAWRDVPNWHRSAELAELVSFAVVNRNDFRGDSELTSLRLVTIPEIGIASSLCRDRVSAGYTLKYWVPEAVREYIVQHHLYSEDA